jgi:hypothetical protein
LPCSISCTGATTYLKSIKGGRSKERKAPETQKIFAKIIIQRININCLSDFECHRKKVN